MASSRKSSSRVIGHLDLLGAQSLAITDPDGFAEGLSDLQAAVRATAAELGDDGAIYLFADCLYFEAADLPSALNFAGQVRSLLLEGRAFFKCAITPGELEAQNFSTGARRNTQKVHGTVFGPGVVPVFLLHNRLRGVGISVSHEFPPEQLKRSGVFQNLYLSGPKAYSAFYDVRLSSDVAEDPKQVALFFENVRQLRVRSRDLPGKYLPLILNFIRSTTFENLDLHAPKLEDRKIPPVMEHLLLGGVGRESLGSLPWFPVLQMALVDQVFQSPSPDTRANAKRTIAKILGSFSKLPIELDRVPNEVLGPEARKALLRG